MEWLFLWIGGDVESEGDLLSRWIFGGHDGLVKGAGNGIDVSRVGRSGSGCGGRFLWRMRRWRGRSQRRRMGGRFRLLRIQLLNKERRRRLRADSRGRFPRFYVCGRLRGRRLGNGDRSIHRLALGGLDRLLLLRRRLHHHAVDKHLGQIGSRRRFGIDPGMELRTELGNEVPNWNIRLHSGNLQEHRNAGQKERNRDFAGGMVSLFGGNLLQSDAGIDLELDQMPEPASLATGFKSGELGISKLRGQLRAAKLRGAGRGHGQRVCGKQRGRNHCGGMEQEWGQRVAAEKS